MENIINICFVCNSEIKGKMYRCTDENMCSEKCCNIRLNIIKNIDPYLTNPYIWNNSINHENKLGNIYEEHCDNKERDPRSKYNNKEHDARFKYDYKYDKDLYCLSLNRQKCLDKMFIYLYMFVGILRHFIY